MNFAEKLANASRKNKSLLCVGLDPDPTRMPPGIDVVQFCHQIIESTSDLVCAYKPNFAFFESLGTDGLLTLERICKRIPDHVPVIADAKRGDIGNTAKKYARSIFDVLGFDAATVNPYLGRDSIEPFMDYVNKGIFILCSTSNSGATDFQQLRCEMAGSSKMLPLFEIVAMKASEWNTHHNIGLVVGATQPEPLKRVRELCPDMPLLIPGVGAQGGDLAWAVKNGVDANGEKAIVNASRQVLYASNGIDFASAARLEAERIRHEINRALGR
ncbi:MAG: orotidine-5'-phosphate decarboxylase [Dehalococcoidia bacterium]|nr:orotidine-5'-phosphate decarboxylase [Dehalococcoidia bacterium]